MSNTLSPVENCNCKFCRFDEGALVILFNGFQKKTQKTPPAEIEKAEKIDERIF